MSERVELRFNFVDDRGVTYRSLRLLTATVDGVRSTEDVTVELVTRLRALADELDLRVLLGLASDDES